MLKALQRAKLFMFLREHRHELFDEEFQAELAETYVDSPKGQPPVPPAQLALATIRQAYGGVSDDGPVGQVESVVVQQPGGQLAALLAGGGAAGAHPGRAG